MSEYSCQKSHLDISVSDLSKIEHSGSFPELCQKTSQILQDKIHGVCFSVYRDNQNPANKSRIDVQQIRDHLTIIKPYVRWIRTLSCTGGHGKNWNLIVDETGGPNHVGNFCDALIIADMRTDTLIFNSSYYYVGHFSKFIRTGAVRIGCEGAGDLFSTAFMNSEGSIVTVIQNEKDEACPCTLLLHGTKYLINMNAHSIVTAILTM